MKTMDLVETAPIGNKSQQLKSAEPKSPNFRANTIQILSNVPETGLSNLMGKAKTVRYLKKEVLGLESNKANSILVIFSGEVRVVSGDNEKHKEVTFHVQDSQSGFGKIALLTEGIRASSIVTLENAVFAVILKRDFKNWLAIYPDLKSVLL